jgi:hypothetical protein|tara:strand:- start:27905 stop:28075 length:171 start_codon:yes stop_codon:yes gene_type:complete
MKMIHAKDAEESDQGCECHPLETEVQALIDLIARLAAERWLREKQEDCTVHHRSEP